MSNRTLRPAVDAEDRELRYALSVRIAKRHADFLNALKRAEDLGTAEALRTAIDRAIDAQEDSNVVETGVVQDQKFTGVPELQHVEVELSVHGEIAEGQEFVDVTHLHWTLSLQEASDLLNQLAAAVGELEDEQR